MKQAERVSAASLSARRSSLSHKPSFWDRDNVSGYVFIAPWLIGFLVFVLVPMLVSLYYSFTDYDLLSAPSFVGLENYTTMLLADPKFIVSMKNTIQFVIISVPLRLAFALFIAMLFTVQTRAEGIYRAVYYLPSLIGGSVAIAVLWKRIFASNGILNALLALVGIETSSNWLGHPNTSLWTLIALAAWQFGSPMLIFLAALKQIPRSLYEAARIDGGNSAQIFFKITLPMLTPIIFFNLVMQMIIAFTIFTQSFVLSGGTGAPLDSLLLYSLYLYRRAFVFFNMGYASAMAWVLLLIVAVFTAIAFYSRKFWVYSEE